MPCHSLWPFSLISHVLSYKEFLSGVTCPFPSPYFLTSGVLGRPLNSVIWTTPCPNTPGLPNTILLGSNQSSWGQGPQTSPMPRSKGHTALKAMRRLPHHPNASILLPVLKNSTATPRHQTSLTVVFSQPN